MKPIRVNDYAEIKQGACAGIRGLVIDADYLLYRVTLRANDSSEITTNWENVEQEEQRSEGDHEI